MTIRSVISDLRSMHRMFGEAQLTDRAIARELNSVALLLVKRDTDKKKLWQSPNLFTFLPCLEFEQKPLAECCEYTSPLSIAKSIQKIPRIAEGVHGLIIQRVSSVDNRTSYKESTPWRYANILKLNLPNKDTYYWIYNDHLWITNPDTKAANLSAFFEDPVPSALLYPENCDCKPTIPSSTNCYNPLDEPYRCPGYLVEAAKQMVSEKLLKSYFRLPADQNQDGVDGQTKTN